MNATDPAQQLVALLRSSGNRLVLAESCTGGLAAARITRISGVSDCFCGSAVTYRDQTKIEWLQVEKMLINTYSAVSQKVAEQMVTGVLSETSEATIAAAITGHLGPNAPDNFDGLVFVSFFGRSAPHDQLKVQSFRLQSLGREPRQEEAANLLYDFVMKAIQY